MGITLVLGAGAGLANGLHFHKSRLSTRNPPLDTTFFEKIPAIAHRTVGITRHPCCQL